MASSARRAARGAKGQLIRELRIKRQLRQEDVAARAGISSTQLSRIECGKVEPSRETIAKVAPVLGVTASYLDIHALVDLVELRATDPETRAFVERVLALHERIALMSSHEREKLFEALELYAREGPS